MSFVLNEENINNLIEIGLKEDIGSGDITTRAILSTNEIFEADILTRNQIVLCGLNIFKAVFYKLDSDIIFSNNCFKEGDVIPSGSSLIKIKGRAVAMLEGERLALNILQRLCGIASLTREYVKKAGPMDVLDTRKTTPGLRLFEKYAVHCGGGKNHRFGLYDAILIKDNHIKAAGGISAAVKSIKKQCSLNLPIEVETTSLKEVNDAILAKCNIIMLDNMSLDKIKAAVSLISGRARVEVSGNISLDNIEELLKVGVDCISVGALTHSPKASDISMNIISTSY